LCWPGCAVIMKATLWTSTRSMVEAVTTIGRFDPGPVELCCLPRSWFISATSLDGSAKLIMMSVYYVRASTPCINSILLFERIIFFRINLEFIAVSLIVIIVIVVLL